MYYDETHELARVRGGTISACVLMRTRTQNLDKAIAANHATGVPMSPLPAAVSVRPALLRRWSRTGSAKPSLSVSVVRSFL